MALKNYIVCGCFCTITSAAAIIAICLCLLFFFLWQSASTEAREMLFSFVTYMERSIVKEAECIATSQAEMIMDDVSQDRYPLCANALRAQIMYVRTRDGNTNVVIQLQGGFEHSGLIVSLPGACPEDATGFNLTCITNQIYYYYE